MNNNRQDIDEHLLLQFLQGMADAELCAAVETWQEADSGNRKLLDSLEALWVETGKISPAPVAVDMERAWARMSERINSQENDNLLAQRGGKIVRMRAFRVLLSAAATILILVGLVAFYRLVIRPAKQTELTSGAVITHNVLPDGSMVTLNRNSKLTYSGKFKDGQRNVKISGEAFFAVKKDAGHPFTVDAGPAGVRVLGTSFRVKSFPGSPIVVSVSEGRVLMFAVSEPSGDTASIVLNPGETGILPVGGTRPVLSQPQEPDGLFWANRSLDFRNTALSEVFMMVKKYYRVNITVSDPGMLNCRLTGAFVDEPVDRILDVIAGSFGFGVDHNGQNYHLTGHGCRNEDH